MGDVITDYNELLLYLDKNMDSSGIIFHVYVFDNVECISIYYFKNDKGVFSVINATIHAVVDALVLGENQPALFEPWYALRYAVTNTNKKNDIFIKNSYNETIKKIIDALPDCEIKRDAISDMIRAEIEIDR